MDSGHFKSPPEQEKQKQKTKTEKEYLHMDKETYKRNIYYWDVFPQVQSLSFVFSLDIM